MTPQPQQAELLVALKSLLALAEESEVWLDGDWPPGACRTIEQLESDGELPPAIMVARELLARNESPPDEPGKCHRCGTQYEEDSEDASYINDHAMCTVCACERPKCKNCQDRVDSEDDLIDGLCPDCHQDIVPPERPGSRAHERKRET